MKLYIGLYTTGQLTSETEREGGEGGMEERWRDREMEREEGERESSRSHFVILEVTFHHSHSNLFHRSKSLGLAHTQRVGVTPGL